MITKREMTNTSEGLPVALVCSRDLSETEILSLRKLVEAWPAAKADSERLPRNYRPRLEFDRSEGRRRLEFLAYWFPKEWYDLLDSYLSSAAKFVERLELGCDFEPPPWSEAFIQVERKNVELEDGTSVEVPPFEVAKYPVSVAEYTRFVEATGYVTLPERAGDEYSFRLNPGWEEIPPEKRGNLPAAQMCYPDVLAYCEWARMRLPSEPEWVAASVIDDTVYATKREADLRMEALRQMAHALAEMHREEFTATVLEEKVVVRSGPYLVRHRVQSWNKFNLRLISQKEFGPIQFRVCKINAEDLRGGGVPRQLVAD